MTSSQRDEALRYKLIDFALGYHLGDSYTKEDELNSILNLILLDRSQHELEVRIDELEKSLDKQWGKGLSGADWKQYHFDRIAGLTAQLEALNNKETE